MDTGVSRHEPSGNERKFVSIKKIGLVPMIATVFMAAQAFAITNPLLNGNQVGSSDLSPFTKWTTLMPRYESQQSSAEGECIGKGCLNQKWEALLKDLEGKSLNAQIDGVNRFFNSIPYVPDQKNYGVADYWQTPYELMKIGGDCEDYAIAKYISLKRLGVSESSMRILIVKDQHLGGIIHALLEVKVDGVAQILDNQAKSVKPVASIFHYQPVFAINESQWWAYK